MRQAALVLLCATLALPPLATADGTNTTAQTAPQKSGVYYNTQTGNISLHLDNVPLVAIIRPLSEQTGLKIAFDPALDTRITTDLTDVPLERAIDIITRGLNVIKEYGQAPVPEKPPLTGITLLPEGQFDPSETITINQSAPKAHTLTQPVTRDPAKRRQQHNVLGQAERFAKQRELLEKRIQMAPPEEKERLQKQLDKLKQRQEKFANTTPEERQAEKKARLEKHGEKLKEKFGEDSTQYQRWLKRQKRFDHSRQENVPAADESGTSTE